MHRFVQEHPDHPSRITAYLERLERQWRVPKSAVRDALQPLLELPCVIPPGERRFRRVFDLYVDSKLPSADAHHVALMEGLGRTEIISFDRDYDQVPGITRSEP